jgi:hypothetical protein
MQSATDELIAHILSHDGMNTPNLFLTEEYGSVRCTYLSNEKTYIIMDIDLNEDSPHTERVRILSSWVLPTLWSRSMPVLEAYSVMLEVGRIANRWLEERK